MIIQYKAKRMDNNEDIKGYLTKMWGQYHITMESDENTAYPVWENSIEPCIVGECNGCINNKTEECLHCMRAYSDCFDGEQEELEENRKKFYKNPIADKKLTINYPGFKLGKVGKSTQGIVVNIDSK